MNFVHRLQGWFSSRTKALSFYKRGMARAKKRDHIGAIDDYTTAIELPASPLDVIAMALFNRALVFVASGQERRGIDDLGVLLAMDLAPVNVKTVAWIKLARIESRSVKKNAY
jgi:hypothetical protein